MEHPKYFPIEHTHNVQLSTAITHTLHNINSQQFPIDIIPIIPCPMGTFKECLICTTWRWKNKEFVGDCWGRATRLPFSPKIREWKWQRGRATHRFLFRRKSASRHFSLWGRATYLPFSPKIRESALLLAPQKESHVRFRPQKAPHASKNASKNASMHASAPAFRLHSTETLLPFSSATSVWPVTLSRNDTVHDFKRWFGNLIFWTFSILLEKVQFTVLSLGVP